MNLYNYLLENFGYKQPILLKELYENLDMNPSTISAKLIRLVDSGKICRYKYKDGIYFIPSPSSTLDRDTLSLNKVVTKLYIFENQKRIGYATGLDFANKLLLTTQNPVNLELVTNKENQRVREVDFKIRKITLRKPRVEKVNDNNYKILQVFDLLQDFENLSTEPLDKASKKIFDYLSDINITKSEFEKCLNAYPEKVGKRVLEINLYHSLSVSSLKPSKQKD